jgi:nitrite reductase/ring-hydroxylating ferredoxin subunit
MLTQEENEILVRTGPGTPMGELFRRFWLPVMLTEEVPEPDCTPARIRILNEDLIGFRDTNGEVGIIDAYCAHRFSPLFFGMNEECGLRCLYHGWKYDVNGQCVDIPFVPEGEDFKEKVQLKSYPALDKGGFIWTYMGPKELQPPFPDFDFAAIPQSHRENWKIINDCNWMQSLEGQNDNSHAFFTHGFRDKTEGGPSLQMGLSNNLFSTVRMPAVAVDTEYGVAWATVWDSDDTEQRITISHHLLPVFDPSPLYDNLRRGKIPLGYQRMRVPIDDVTCMVMRVRWNPEAPLAEEFKEAHNEYLIPEKIPGTYRTVANKANDYLIDREMQRTFNYSGIPNFPLQDICQIEDQGGAIMDRTREKLTSQDMVNIHIRHQLIKAARDLMEGKEPAAPHRPELFKVKDGIVTAQKDKPVEDILKEALKSLVPAA